MTHDFEVWSYVSNDDPGDVDTAETLPCPRGPRGHHATATDLPCCAYGRHYRALYLWCVETSWSWFP